MIGNTLNGCCCLHHCGYLSTIHANSCVTVAWRRYLDANSRCLTVVMWPQVVPF